MKQKLLTLLLTALLGLTGMNAWALDQADGVYQIGTAQDLADFAGIVNGGETTAKAVLTADIDCSSISSWTPIGDWSTNATTSGFKGHFNGQGHRIYNVSFTTFARANSYAKYQGLFGIVMGGAIIENFTLEGEMIFGFEGNGDIQCAGSVAAYARDATSTIRNVHSKVNITNISTHKTGRMGGILGCIPQNSAKGVIQNCTYSGTFNTGNHTGNYGGILGYVQNNSGTQMTITNCLFDGKLINSVADGAQCGGIIGYSNSGTVTIKNCLSIGTIDYEDSNKSNVGAFLGRLAGNNLTYTNNYYASGHDIGGTSGTGTAKGAAPIVVTASQLTSGEVCYLLNESISGGTNWFQTLMDDDYPFPFNGGVHDPIYANGSFLCDGVTSKGSISYGNTDASTIDPHDFADGFCTVCDAWDGVYSVTPNADDTYEIGTANQLKWFAIYANNTDHAANAILVNDIDMTGKTWTPIGAGSGNGTGTTAYAGTFDGQGFSITGFNTVSNGRPALFGDVTGATIKNFNISGTITATGGYGGGVVGWPTNTTIENIHSALVINVPNTDTHHVGGIVGSARGGNTISGCTFSGSLTVASSTDNFAGVAGYITNGDKVINCANYGSVTFSASGCAAGGIVGYVNAQQATIQNSLSTGQVTFDGDGTPTYGAAVIGRTKGFSTDYVKNNYWLEGTAYGTIHNNNGTEAMETGCVTSEQLASGEVAYNLGEAWNQLIGTDATPLIGTENPVFYVGAVGYATLYDTAKDWKLNGDATAYIADFDGVYLDLIKIDDIPASTPVILKGTYYNKLTTTATSDVSANDLKGTETDTEADGTMYVLAKPEADEESPEGYDIGFYRAKTGSTIKAGKAYFQYIESGSGNVKAFYFAEDNADAIEKTLSNSPLKGENIYNVAGQKLSKMQKGINIVGGKKVMVK